jgi:hypothetical protein
MSEHVRSLDLGVIWDPNSPEAVLLCLDSRAALSMGAGVTDQDRRNVVLTWESVRHASIGSPNDETASGHPLWGKGLRDVLWAGAVEDSSLIASLNSIERTHSRHNSARFDGDIHYIVLSKEDTIEVVAKSVRVERFGGNTLDAAVEALRR